MRGVPLIAAFETEFHATIPEHASQYGVPAAWRDAGVRRYGFHGASHQYIGERVAAMLGRPKEALRTISCHLGGSSSICAIERGRSVDTTMGFSPQSGLENATRHGDLDAFAVLFMMEHHGWTAEEVREQLAREGGLAGLSGVAGGDVRDIQQAAAAGNRSAANAIEVFAYQVRKTIGAYATAMGGVDAVAFTGGIGENSPELRAVCCAGLEFLGIRLDSAANDTSAGDRLVSEKNALVAVLALSTNEELIVARRAHALLTH
jgi:acetate kinase